jgi:hypothetical protein
MKPILLTVFAAALTTGLPSYAGNACEVKSGASTAALVELYTSEGCSSCPPADKQLSSLKQQLDPGAVVVPLSLHVSYWDDIGWKDVFAKKTFDQRQSELVAAQHTRVVYTPQFFVNGNEVRSWRNNLPSTIRQINAVPAPVAITLKTSAPNANTIALDATVNAKGREKVDGDLYVAISENDLNSKVLRGENSGVTLHHDNTVRQWYGPIALAQGTAQFHQELALPAGWKRDNLQAVAFVQAPNEGNVLQAISTAQCMPSATRGL